MSTCFSAFLILVVAMSAMPDPAQAQARIDHAVFGGGLTFVDTNHGGMLQGTLGQPVIGRATNFDVMSANGYWYLWIKSPTVTAVGGETPELLAPRVTRLHPNSPNPFNPRTEIRFELAEEGPVRLELFDLRGRRVATMIDEWMDVGEHQHVFRPLALASGVYFYRLSTRDSSFARSMVLVR